MLTYHCGLPLCSDEGPLSALSPLATLSITSLSPLPVRRPRLSARGLRPLLSSLLSGDLDSLLEAYDRERRAVPSPVDFWQWGWTKSAETWNGRVAMIGIWGIVALELFSGRSLIKQLLNLD